MAQRDEGRPSEGTDINLWPLYLSPPCDENAAWLYLELGDVLFLENDVTKVWVNYASQIRFKKKKGNLLFRMTNHLFVITIRKMISHREFINMDYDKPAVEYSTIHIGNIISFQDD